MTNRIKQLERKIKNISFKKIDDDIILKEIRKMIK